MTAGYWLNDAGHPSFRAAVAETTDRFRPLRVIFPSRSHPIARNIQFIGSNIPLADVLGNLPRYPSLISISFSRNALVRRTDAGCSASLLGEG